MAASDSLTLSPYGMPDKGDDGFAFIGDATNAMECSVDRLLALAYTNSVKSLYKKESSCKILSTHTHRKHPKNTATETNLGGFLELGVTGVHVNGPRGSDVGVLGWLQKPVKP